MTRLATLIIENGIPVLQNEISVDLKDVPSSDPLAFMAGVQKGQHNAQLLSKDRSHKIDHRAKFTELAPEYIRGFLFGFRGILVPEGTKIRKGEEQNLFHLSKDISSSVIKKK